MIGRNLTAALLETVQQHADRYCRGKVDQQRTLSALGEVATELLSAIRDPRDRVQAFEIILDGVFKAAEQKAKNRAEIPKHTQ
jgi:hypothetical protein